MHINFTFPKFLKTGCSSAGLRRERGRRRCSEATTFLILEKPQNTEVLQSEIIGQPDSLYFLSTPKACPPVNKIINKPAVQKMCSDSIGISGQQTGPAHSEKSNGVSRFENAADIKNCKQPDYCGLLHYRKWWERVETEISVNGRLITGIPVFAEENTLRVINNSHSYFIPLGKIDYIRTKDGLHSSFEASADKPL